MFKTLYRCLCRFYNGGMENMMENNNQYLTEYEEARRIGLREYNRSRLKGENPYLQPLEQSVPSDRILSEVELETQEIMIKKIAGTKNQGRSTSFSTGFMPLLDTDSEFASKWTALCKAHNEEGIRDAIIAYEYLGRYYVLEGNKRVSVLKYYKAVQIMAKVIRLVPKFEYDSEELRIYRQYLDFYKKTKVNFLWFSKVGNFPKCYRYIEKFQWTGDNIIQFKSFYFQFRSAYYGVSGNQLPITTGDAFLHYLDIYGYTKDISNSEMTRQIKGLWEEFENLSKPNQIDLTQSEQVEPKSSGFLSELNLFGIGRKHLKVAFIHAGSPDNSEWVYQHELGKNHVETKLEGRISTESFFNIAEDEGAYEKIKEIAEQGFDVIFTTTPTFVFATLKAALEFRQTIFLNCSEAMSYQNVRSYFGRIYEAHFLTGMVAGAMTETNIVGYAATYPIPEFISSINAYTLGARFVNPYAKVYLKWVSECKENCLQQIKNTDLQFQSLGADIVMHQESNVLTNKLQSSGLYFIKDRYPFGQEFDQNFNNYLAIPLWNWGVFYEKILISIINGDYSRSKLFGSSENAINYWWGLSSGVVEFFYSKNLLSRELIRSLEFMKKMMVQGNFQPFSGEIYDNKGRQIQTEGQNMTSQNIMSMDFLIEGVLGSIPDITIRKGKDAFLDLLGVKKRYES
ncbi:BMP family ABC transporter substrate-binding protein [Clostridiales bacterium COT073_COT-073]|nr:BMP family ABC transporter substrate-binding protein [Clostridiales bacterium COT073_COT-073]